MGNYVVRRPKRRKSLAVHAKSVPDEPPRNWRKVFLRAMEMSPNLTSAAEVAGVTASYVRAQIKADPEFAAEVEQARESCVDLLEGVGFKMATDGDGQMVRFFLRAHRPDRYGEKVAPAVGLGVDIDTLIRVFEEQGLAREALLHGLRRLVGQARSDDVIWDVPGALAAPESEVIAEPAAGRAAGPGPAAVTVRAGSDELAASAVGDAADGDASAVGPVRPGVASVSGSAGVDALTQQQAGESGIGQQGDCSANLAAWDTDHRDTGSESPASG